MTMHGINSLSSSIIYGVTLFRNQQGTGNKILGEIGYISAAGVATVESVAALAFTIISLAAYPVSSKPLEHSVAWLKSSSFSIVWALTDCVLNPRLVILVADEASARQIAQSCNLGSLPRGAII